MHHIYHTKGFVLSSKSRGEADKILVLYTRELGLIKAVAQGIRLEKSKSRFALQDFSLADIDLVRGRDIWRVTSSKPENSFPFLRTDKKSFELFFKIAKLLDRLCPGEESNKNIFDAMVQVFHLLDSGSVTTENREAMELYLVLKIMHELGYIGESKTLNEYLNGDFENKKIYSLLKEKKFIIANINNAIRQSHL